MNMIIDVLQFILLGYLNKQHNCAERMTGGSQLSKEGHSKDIKYL